MPAPSVLLWACAALPPTPAPVTQGPGPVGTEGATLGECTRSWGQVSLCLWKPRQQGPPLSMATRGARLTGLCFKTCPDPSRICWGSRMARGYCRRLLGHRDSLAFGGPQQVAMKGVGGPAKDKADEAKQ